MSNVLAYGVIPKNKTIHEYTAQHYRAIGQYIQDHAVELAKGVTETTGSIELVVKITPSEITTLEQKIMSYVMTQGEVI